MRENDAAAAAVAAAAAAGANAHPPYMHTKMHYFHGFGVGRPTQYVMLPPPAKRTSRT